MLKFILLWILLLAFVLRIAGIASLPVGFTPDEASFGYDAYSLLHTGKDQWGQSWPLTFRSFGDFKLPLYTYLTLPSIAVFGLNEFAARLPSAVFGTLAVLATYLLAGLVFKDKKVQILAAFLLVISPWHISLSRGAFEANLTTFFVAFGMWAFLKGIKSTTWMGISALSFGLNLFSYHSARIFTLLLILALLWKNRGEFRLGSFGKYKIAVVMFGIFFVAAFYTMFTGAGSRGSDVAIFNPTDKWASVADRRYEAVLSGMPDGIERVFVNKILYSIDQFIGGYFSYISPQFLFTQGAGEWTYGMIPGRGVLYLIEVLFLASAILVMIRKPVSVELKVIILWILLSPIPAALAKGPGFAANRAAVMMPAIQLISAYGGVVLYNFLQNKFRNKNLRQIILPGYIVLLFVSLLFFVEDYKYHAPNQGASGMLYGRKEAVEFAQTLEDQYPKVIFSRSLSEPHIYVAFYKQWDPSDYQKQSQDWLRYEAEKRSFVDQLGEYSLGKYVFGDVNLQKKENTSGVLLVGKANEFPQNLVPLKVIKYPNGQKDIEIVDPLQATYAASN